jgi:hypothetical protein
MQKTIGRNSNFPIFARNSKVCYDQAMPAISNSNTVNPESERILRHSMMGAVVPSAAKRLRESVADRVCDAFERKASPGNRMASGEEKITDLMARLIRGIPDENRRKLFWQQCEIVQSYVQKKRLSAVPAEHISLLLSGEWKKINRGLASESLGSLGKLADEVIFSLENSVRKSREALIAGRKGFEFKTTPNGLRYVLENTGSKGILKIVSIERNKFSQSDIFRLLRSDRKIDEIRIHPNANSETKRALMDILSENRPLLGILRIIPE